MSTEIKCLVCGHSYSVEEPVCPTCKFPNISMTSDSPEERARILQMAEEYKKAHWNFPEFYNVYLIVYKNAVVPGETIDVGEPMETWEDIRQESSEQVLLGDTEMLEDGVISWYPENFARQSEDITVKIRMVPKTEGKNLNFAVHMDSPETDDFWRIGLLMKDGELKLALGSLFKYTLSNSIPYKQQ